MVSNNSNFKKNWLNENGGTLSPLVCFRIQIKYRLSKASITVFAAHSNILFCLPIEAVKASIAFQIREDRVH